MCSCNGQASTSATPSVPLARTVVLEVDGEDPTVSSAPLASTEDLPRLPLEQEIQPFPPFTFCRNVFKEGCYALDFTPSAGVFTYQGTLRVDRSAPDGGPDGIIVSGDLYRGRIRWPHFPTQPLEPLTPVPDPGPLHPGPVHPGPSVAAQASSPDSTLVPIPSFLPRIPIFARSLYRSYLKVVSVSAPVIAPHGQPCRVTLVAEQYDYTQPPAGSFTGSFPVSPSRTVTISLTQGPSSFPFFGPNLTGRWVVDGVDRGEVSLRWVSRFFRRATVEVDTLAGAVAPTPVPDGAGGTEYFDTIYAKHGWDLRVVQDQSGVAVPAGVDPDSCWGPGDLHGLMAANRNPATNLDTEWRLHLMVVPAELGCGRGVMYDTIDVPREGSASFCDDGYPSNESASFGTAANQHQRDVPRAFLRSATHEITHTFNQIHQEQETVADNSIMTTTRRWPPCWAARPPATPACSPTRSTWA